MTEEPLDHDLDRLLGEHPRVEVTPAFERRVLAAIRAAELEPIREAAGTRWRKRVVAGAVVAVLAFSIGRLGSTSGGASTARETGFGSPSPPPAELESFLPIRGDDPESSVAQTWREIQFIEQTWGF